MTAPRRLSSIPAPMPGEAFTSWVARSAEFHELTTNQMLEFLRVPVGSPRLRYGVELDLFALMNLVDTSGLRPVQARAMFLRGGRDRRGTSQLSWDWRKAGKRLPWLWRPRESAVCPECLAQQPAAWKLEWRLLTVVACAEHQLYLHSWCPSCRSPINISARPDHVRICSGPSAEFLLHREDAHDRWRSSRKGKRGCGARLDELPRYPLVNDKLLGLQRLLTERVITGPGMYAISQTYERDLHMALRFAVQLGTLEMLDSKVDPPVWSAFSLFQRVRDRVARIGGYGAEFQYSSLYTFKPGPMLMAAAINIVAALSEDVDDPIQAATRIVEHYTDRVAKLEFRLLERALVGNDVFGNAAVTRIKALRDLELGPVMGWRERLPFVADDDGLVDLFGRTEELVALGEWAMAVTSPATAEQPDHE